jgi:hypothetical protein
MLYTFTAFSGLIAEALASFCELPASCGYALAMSGYTDSQGQLATSPLASASRWPDRLARAWVAGPWACCYGMPYADPTPHPFAINFICRDIMPD